LAVEPSGQETDSAGTGADLAARVHLRSISNEEGNRLLRIVVEAVDLGLNCGQRVSPQAVIANTESRLSSRMAITARR
jgi:hypothetical protein